MRFLLIGFLLALSSVAAKAQSPANAWVNHQQSYFFFPIVTDGIYRIDSTTLANSLGAVFNTIDPRNLQLFARGKELPVFVSGEGDGIFNGQDYLEFYATGNDGRFDSVYIDQPLNHSNPFYSYYTDTIYYYLTWNSSVNNLRATLETDVNFPAYPIPAWFWRELRYARPGDDITGYNPKYYFGARINSMTDPRFGKSSGWMDSETFYGGTKLLNFPTQGFFNGGPDARAQVYFASQTDPVQSPDHHIRVSYGGTQIVYDTTFNGFQSHLVDFSIPAASLSGTTGIQVASVADLNPPPTTENFSLGYAQLKYPHIQDLEGKSFIRIMVPDVSGAGKFRLDAGNFNGTSPVIYDVSNGKKITAQVNGGQVQALIPDAGNEKLIVIANTSTIQNVPQLKPVNGTGSFIDYSIYQGDFLIISHPSLLTAAYDYAAFRSSAGFQPVVASTEDLYHQFGMGIRNHPFAIRNFVHYATTGWQDTAKYLFLFGKGIHAYQGRNNPTQFNACLVPSAGAKSSDILITSGLNGSGWAPAIATGRLAALTVQDADDYLNKTIDYESWYNNPKPWMKHVAHFHGGNSSSEQAVLSAYLNGYKTIITDTLFGARVFDFYKNSTAPIQGISLVDSIRSLINSGTNLLTFFGHAAGSSFDINIDQASTYNNAGKYPFVLANSCLVGDIFQYNVFPPTTSEDFVLTPNKGAIGFIASIGLGTAADLNIFSTELYRQFSSVNYLGAVSSSMKKAFENIQNWYPTWELLRINLQQMNLHGDPALRLYGYEKPDLAILPGKVWFNPAIPTLDVDSIDLHVVAVNQGRAFNKTYLVEVMRTFFDGTTDTLIKTVAGTYYADTLTFTFPTDAARGGGVNTFTIRLDSDPFLIDELNENNNDTTLQLFIRSDDVIPAWPVEYAVVPSGAITLKASTADPFVAHDQYRFEIDTSARFNSPVRESGLVSAPGGLIRWTPTLPVNGQDSTVYFWRVARDTSAGNFKWRNSSFQVIAGQRGWGQAHFDQYDKDELTFLKRDTINRLFVLDQTSKHLIANNIGNPAVPTVTYGIEYKIDAQLQDYGGCGWTPALHVVVIDSLTLKPWGKKWTNTSVNPNVTYNPGHNFGNINNENSCRNRVEYYFIFNQSSPTQMDSMASMLLNKVPAGNYLMVYSYLRPMRSQWTPNLVNAFNALGAGPQITGINDSIPFIFFVKKGDAGTVQEIVGPTPTAQIQLNVPMQTSIRYGKIKSTLIGPAMQWNSLYMQQTHLEQPTADSAAVTIYGVNQGGHETFLGHFYGDDVAELNLSGVVNANLYPWMRIEAFKGDDSLLTSPQLYRWQVLYDPAPELALNPGAAHLFKSNEVAEGQPVQWKMAVTNIGDQFMDSVFVGWYSEDAMRNRTQLKYKKYPALDPDSTFITEVELPTLGRAGVNTFYLDANPLDPNWVKEQHHFNNIAARQVDVKADRTNPLLDVTFDGVHILNRDIVSPSSRIVVSLKDENQFLALNDTADFLVMIESPDGSIKRLQWDNGDGNGMLFYPASLPSNSCRIEYVGNFPMDGIYTLMVDARDKSGNESGGKAGEISYRIEFEVINKSSITEVLNYPNPFSTSTRFVFTLTGSRIPDRFRIQILTVTGKVVKQISREELGPIRIGRNITEYAWDGTDDYGDRLANGIYLYRVLTEIDGSGIEHRSTEADGYFHKGFGKMYLLR